MKKQYNSGLDCGKTLSINGMEEIEANGGDGWTKELFHQLFEYKSGDLYWKVDRGSNKVKGKKVGNLNSIGYLMTSINKKIIKNHRIIFMMFHGYMPKIIDHINNIKTDNRIENLREATVSENNKNVKTRKDNISGFKGISWHKSTKKWQVQVSVNGKQIDFGRFDDIELADLVAQEARNKYHKEFARHK